MFILFKYIHINTKTRETDNLKWSINFFQSNAKKKLLLEANLVEHLASV